jgi:hypothetical protein
MVVRQFLSGGTQNWAQRSAPLGGLFTYLNIYELQKFFRRLINQSSIANAPPTTPSRPYQGFSLSTAPPSLQISNSDTILTPSRSPIPLYLLAHRHDRSPQSRQGCRRGDDGTRPPRDAASLKQQQLGATPKSPGEVRRHSLSDRVHSNSNPSLPAP